MIFDDYMNILSTGDVTQLLGEESSDSDASQDLAEPSACTDSVIWNNNVEWNIDEDGWWYRVE